MSNDKQQVTIVLPKNVHQELRRQASEAGTSMAALIREAVANRLQDEEGNEEDEQEIASAQLRNDGGRQMVGARRFELPASASRTLRANQAALRPARRILYAAAPD